MTRGRPKKDAPSPSSGRDQNMTDPITTTKPRTSPNWIALALYLSAIILVLAAVWFGDWETIGKHFFNREIAASMWPDVLLIAAKNTMLATVISFSLGLPLALIWALMRMSTVRPYRWFATAYVELFRGLPALITILLIGFGIPIAFGFKIPGGALGRGTVGLAIVSSAYMAETIRAGIEAVPRGQMEAARSLGMKKAQAMFSIVLPQAFRIVIPPLTNEFVLLIKDTSLFFVLGTTPASKELTKFAQDLLTSESNSTPLTVVAVAYLVITLPLTQLVRQLEKRNAKTR